jgi:hypothetical protein
MSKIGHCMLIGFISLPYFHHPVGQRSLIFNE